MSSSSSSTYSGGDDNEFSRADEPIHEDFGFDGWDDSEITFDDAPIQKTAAAPAAQIHTEEAWPDLLESAAPIKKLSMTMKPIGQKDNNDDDNADEDFYDGDMEDDENVIDEEEAMRATPVPTPKSQTEETLVVDENDIEDEDLDVEKEEDEAREAEEEAAEKKRRAEEEERTLQRKQEQADREKREADEAVAKVRAEREKAEKARRDAELAAQKAVKERKEADDAKRVAVAQQPSEKEKPKPATPKPAVTATPKAAAKPAADLDPIPKESAPAFVERTDDAANMPAKSRFMQSSAAISPKSTNDYDSLLVEHAVKPLQLTNSRKDEESLNLIGDALKGLFEYVATPSSKRAPTFKNNFYVAKSKDVTSDTLTRVQSAMNFISKLKPVATDVNNRELYKKTTLETSIEPLLRNIAHTLCAYVTSQQNVPTSTRRALSQALIADVIQKSEKGQIAHAALLLAFVVGNLLLSEAAALKTAELVAETPHKKNEFHALRVRIVNEVAAFVASADYAMPTASVVKQTMESIASVSKTFDSAALKYSPTETNLNGHKSYGTALAVMLREYVRYNPVNRSLAEGGSAPLVQLLFQVNLLMPDTIMYPRATFDVLAGMLDGVKGALSAVDVESDRTQIIELWNRVKKLLGGQSDYLSSSSLTQQKQTKVESVKPVAAKTTTDKFIRRFADDSDSE